MKVVDHTAVDEPRRFEPHMRLPAHPSEATLFFCVRGDRILMAEAGEDVEFPAEPPAGLQHVIGSLGERLCVAVDVDADESHSGLTWLTLRQLYGRVPVELWTIAGRASQIVSWDRTHRFCGACGAETKPLDEERARRCPACDLVAYPRLSPAIIVLVTRGAHDEETLLAWGRRFPTRFYSTLAGFVEPGESLEEAVVREVREETGIEVSDVRYFGSQPWPFPHQLMVGFRARYAGGELSLQESEIVEAGWFRAEEVHDLPAPRGGMSIASWLIEDWLAAQRA